MTSIVAAPSPVGHGLTVPSSPNPLDGGWLYENGTEDFGGATDLLAHDLLVWLALASDATTTTPYDQLYGLDAALTEDGVAWDIDIDRKWYDAAVGACVHVRLAHRWFASAPSAGYWAQFRSDSSFGSNFDSTAMLKIRGVGSNPAFHEFAPDGPFVASGLVSEANPDGRYFVFSGGSSYFSRVLGGNYDHFDGGMALYAQVAVGGSASIGVVSADSGGLSDVTDYGDWTPYSDSGVLFGAPATHRQISLTDVIPAAAVAYVSGRRTF